MNERENKLEEYTFESGGSGEFMGFTMEKPQNFRQAWQKLLRYCRKYLSVIVFALLLSAVGTVFQIAAPSRLQNMVDEISKGLMSVDGINLEAVAGIALVLAVLYGLSFLFSLTEGIMMAMVTQKISQRLRRDISAKINRLPLRYFDRVSQGDVISRVANDVDAIGMTLNQSMGTLISAAAMFIGSVIMMFATNWTMALTAIGASVIGFFIMMLLMSQSQKYFTRQQQGLGNINGFIEEIYTGHEIVKAYSYQKEARRRFDKYNNILFDSNWRSQFLSGMMMPLMSLIGNLGYVAVCVVGAALTMNGTISFSVIIAFMMYVNFFNQPLSQFAQATQQMQRTAAASERVFDFLDESEMENESHKGKRLENVRGDVVFEHVRFGYTPEKIIINDFSAHVKPGQKIAIVGPTGAGKTTLINLLMRFYEMFSGRILIDHTSITDVPRENLRNQFAMVLQDTWIFDGTIKENIVYRMKGVTEEQIIAASKAAGLHHFVKTLPDGYDTVLNENSGISQGQRQLVTIARAMIQNAPMLILDEATSSVDTRTEIQIQKAMDRLMAGRTSFVIAHRLSTIKNADMILVMKDGDIIESGKHEELLARGGFYADLYQSQFENTVQDIA